jgi:hypothetical protein
MQNIVRLTPMQILNLAERLTYADANGRSVRIMTGTDKVGPFIKYDIGSGWTAPIYGLEY